jgi:hypothetical protein
MLASSSQSVSSDSFQPQGQTHGPRVVQAKAAAVYSLKGIVNNATNRQ